MGYNFEILKPGSGYESIRNIIGVDNSLIPNNLIEDEEVGPLSEMEVKRAFPRYKEVKDSIELVNLRSAVNHLIASKVCQVLKVKFNQAVMRVRGVDFRIRPLEWDKMSEEFMNRAYSKLKTIPLYNESVASYSTPIAFGGITSRAKKDNKFIGIDYTDPVRDPT